MKTQITLTVIALVLGVAAALLCIDSILQEHRIHSAKVVHTDMPPGFKLVCNAKGDYGVARSGNDLFIELYSGQRPTKQNAIERAWSQYEYELEPKKEEAYFLPYAAKLGWHDCEVSDNAIPDTKIEVFTTGLHPEWNDPKRLTGER